ncbi:hypothetical protein AZI85_12780 [Bdellovibrio bacteriovorus]|uniref:Host attachment protein n=1 Tax=Bdellovibrio bacteriovorus TaxID=959 RepID=A0A150WCA3_BDEBC|nr:host attachment protein [Bdellovibrio bacteriovorus]KYG60488.1 hypothetical protein AZI85_12780 [Bdellovibrio bacteriovorus]
MKTWICVVNRSEAKIFEHGNNRSADVQFVTKLSNPRGRLKAQDINADKPGSFVSGFTTHGMGREKIDSPTEHVAQEFAKQVSQFLYDSCQQHLFEELVLIAEPQCLGRLRGLLSKEVRQCIVQEIPKDLVTAATTTDLKERLRPMSDLRSATI